MQIRTVYSTNDGMNKEFGAEPNEHGDVVAIGADPSGLYSINTFSTRRNESSYAIVSRDELRAICDMIRFELGETTTHEWREARRAFLALPAGHADARAALNRLSEAEDRLYNAI